MTQARYIRRSTVAFAVIAAGACGIIGILSAGYALLDPLELEAREGTVWLHVLAETAGVSLYDHTQTAFINMNHGPLDPILKGWIHQIAPIFPAQLVTRFFVGCLPLGIAWLFTAGFRRPLAGLLWAAGLYVFLLGLTPASCLIGRSDPAALFFLCLLMGLVDVARHEQPASAFHTTAVGAAVGLFAATIVLLNWRFAPSVLGCILVIIVEYAADQPHGARMRAACAFFAGSIVAGIAAFAAVLTMTFHGDLTLYRLHFFAVFSRDSGWGLMGRMPYELLPYELFDRRTPFHIGVGAAIILASLSLIRKPKGRVRVFAWMSALALIWFTTTWGFAINHGGGGLHYFSSFYLIAAYFVASRTNWAALSLPTVLLLGTFLMVNLPITLVSKQVGELASTTREARRFSDELTALIQGTSVYSEDVHLFKRTYTGEVVDVGDMVTSIAAGRAFPTTYRETVERHYRQLEQAPPEFVVAGAAGVISPRLANLVKTRYTEVDRSGPIIMFQQLPIIVYRLRPTSP